MAYPEGVIPGLQNIDVMPGISLSILNTVQDYDASASMERDGRSVEFSYVLSGRAKAISRCGQTTHTIEVTPNAAFSHYRPDSLATFSIKGNQQLQMLGIDFDLELLKTLLEEDEYRIADRIFSSPDRMFNQIRPLTPVQKMVVTQMLSCSLNSFARKLFMQSKALELLSYQMEYLHEEVAPEASRRRKAVLSSDEIDRIHFARETLRDNMTGPPSLLELSALAGININKLKKGFRAVFDRTPFGKLHDDRMERAHELLSCGSHNVSEAAWEVGYTNVGHFSAAFKKHFGVRPKAYQLEVGKRFRAVS